jgi:PncC family amidohydrolase
VWIASESYSTFQASTSRLVSSIREKFTGKGITLSTAESITGGLIGSTLVSLPGSSIFFKGGVVAYSNESKEKILGVRHRTLTSHGAVSRETALEMAYGALRLFETSMAVSCTGIAGPAGETTEKPVGLVYMAIVTDRDSAVKEVRYDGDRDSIRMRTVEDCLQMIEEEASKAYQQQ